MNLCPLIQKMEIVAVDGVSAVHCLVELLLLQTLPLGFPAGARRSFRSVFGSYCQPHVGHKLPGGFIGRQIKQLRGEVDHVAFLLTSEADEILIDLHARRFVLMERALHHAVPADLVPVMLCHGAGADLLFDLGIDAQKYHLLSIRK